MRMRIWACALAALLAMAPGPAVAQAAAAFHPGLPGPQDIADADDRAQIDRLQNLLREADPATDAHRVLTETEQILKEMRRPTMGRGVVQFIRGSILSSEDRNDEARAALAESIRLLPDHSAPSFAAAYLESYGDHPAAAIDHLVNAGRISPDIMRRFPDFEVTNLFSRLNYANDRQAGDRLALLLLDHGWRGARATARSGLAARIIRVRAEAGDMDGARALVPELIDPSDSRALLMNRLYAPLWDDIETWAGPAQSVQWAIYLREAERRWRNSREPADGSIYLAALAEARRDHALVSEFLPIATGPVDPVRDYDLLFMVPALSAALARLGRWDEADAMIDGLLGHWPEERHANHLNLSISRARNAIARGNLEEGLAGMDSALVRVAAFGAQISPGVTDAIQHERACVLSALGRLSEAETAARAALRAPSPVTKAQVHLCLDRTKEARNVLIAALDDPARRAAVLGFVQKRSERDIPSDFARQRMARIDALRIDPDLVAAIAPYGRILDTTLAEGAPDAPTSL